MKTQVIGLVKPRKFPRRPSRMCGRGERWFWLQKRGHWSLLLHWRQWHGIYAAALHEPGCHWGEPVQRFPKPETKLKKKNVAVTRPDGPSHLASVESTVFGALHPLVAHCAVTRYDDGDPRRPGWLTIQTRGSSWAVILKDPDSSSSLTAIGTTLDDALALASVLLEADSTPWEHDQWLANQSKKGGKK